MRAAQSSLAASGGMSTASMAACCAHYLVPLLPAMGLPFLSTAVAGIAEYQSVFFFLGVLSNLFGIGFMLRLMKRNGIIKIPGDPPAGHHRGGVLEFPAIAKGTKSITMYIINIAGVPERTFEWKLE